MRMPPELIWNEFELFFSEKHADSLNYMQILKIENTCVCFDEHIKYTILTSENVSQEKKKERGIWLP